MIGENVSSLWWEKGCFGHSGIRITIQNLYGMKQFIFAILFLTICTGLPFGCAQQAQTADEEADRMAIEQVIDQYITSINRCDTSIVNRIWSHGDEVSFIAPSGYYATYHAIRDQLVVGLFGAYFTQRELKKSSLKISINGDSAWSEFYWTFHATKLDGTPHDTKGRETQIFERSADGSWRLVHIHYSGGGTR